MITLTTGPVVVRRGTVDGCEFESRRQIGT